MKTSHLITLTATIVACTAATASARPAVEPPGSQASKPSVVTPGGMAAHRDQVRSERWQRSQASKPSVVTPGGMAAHRDQVRSEQWQRSQAQPAPAPLTDRTATDDGVPLGLVLIGVTVPLGILIVAIGKPVLGRHRRHPTSVA